MKFSQVLVALATLSAGASAKDVYDYVRTNCTRRRKRSSLAHNI